MSASRLSCAKVLIVGQDPQAGRTATALFNGEARSATWVRTIGEATIAMDDIGPDLVIIDRWLPDGDGLELCASLRRPGSRYVPVILLTSSRSSSECMLALKRGADDYVEKPFHPMELLARAEALVRRLPPLDVQLPQENSNRRPSRIQIRRRIFTGARRIAMEQKP